MGHTAGGDGHVGHPRVANKGQPKQKAAQQLFKAAEMRGTHTHTHIQTLTHTYISVAQSTKPQSKLEPQSKPDPVVEPLVLCAKAHLPPKPSA